MRPSPKQNSSRIWRSSPPLDSDCHNISKEAAALQTVKNTDSGARMLNPLCIIHCRKFRDQRADSQPHRTCCDFLLVGGLTCTRSGSQQNGGLPPLRLELDRVCMLVRKVRSACGENMPEAQRILHLRGENAVALPRCGPPGPAGKRTGPQEEFCACSLQ
ncbi:hypothetical protein CapIbe_011462 [Capra ibex]